MLKLPASLDDFNQQVLGPALALLPISMDTPAARALLMAITKQESGLASRWQILDGGGKGPARGLQQFERNGGVKGVMEHPASTGLAHRVCAERGVPWDRTQIWNALEMDDLLATCFARLLLYTDPRPLPKPEAASVNDAWEYYVRNWRPGKPHHEFWPGNWARALEHVGVL